MGRSAHITWGNTAAHIDTGDVWQERVSEDEREYFVDGEWRKLATVEEVIKVQGHPDHVFTIKSTHRGPLLRFEELQMNLGLLFNAEPAAMSSNHWYSLAWQGRSPGDNSFSLLFAIYESKDLPELFAKIDGDLGKSYKGLGSNILFADTSGNIGYRLIHSIQERRDKTPFIGSRVLDGTKSSFDWSGELVHLKDLPQSLNPKKGFLMSANGRQTSDNVVFDYGATVNCPARVVRITELLREATESGKKLSLADLGAMQQDVVDVVARRMKPKLLKIIAEADHHLSQEQKKKIGELVRILGPWEGDFAKTSVGASVYTRWYI